MSGPILALLGLFVFAGASAQRITGMGFALVSSPFLVLVLGPATGVGLTIILGMVATGAVLVQVWRDVEWRIALLLLVPALVGILPGRWGAARLPAPLLAVVVGGLVIIAVLTMLLSERAHVLRGWPGAVVAGLLSGFMNTTAAVGGPAIVVYAMSTKWRHEAFVATVQVYLLALSAVTLVAIDPVRLPLGGWLAAFGGLAVGMVVGTVVAQRVSAARARQAVIVLALLGSATIVVKGVADLIG